MARNDPSSSLRPTITLPPRSAGESLFDGGGAASPGPMTLVSNFFSENDPDSDCRSFSQLLAGDISDDGADLRFKRHRPDALAVGEERTMFMVPPGMSPASLLTSPGWNQGPLVVSHQQPSALVSAQENSHFQFPTEFSSNLSAAPALALPHHPPASSNGTTTHQHIPDNNMKKEYSNVSYSDQRSLATSIVVDKPADDGYNWRKYGQKQVKGSEFPRSYYKCTIQKCPVKKKVERSLDGQITEIIYKGQHNHQPPQMSKRSKDNGYLNGSSSHHENSELHNRKNNSENLSGTSDSEDECDAETKYNERNEDEPDAKRRVADQAVASHRALTEPKIIVQTTSEVDLLDDGYRWRKYGQKVVKGNPYPRSYYKCTSQACNVRKHIERAASDPKAVITTYEGKHNHDVPAARNSSHTIANNNNNNNNNLQLRPQNAFSDKHHSLVRNNDSQQITQLRFKEEFT